MGNVTIRIDPILPKGNFPINYLEDFEKRVLAYFNGKLNRKLSRAFQSTVQGWEHYPNFPVRVWRPYGVRIQLNIGPKGRYTTQWTRVSLGTKPHFIFPKASNKRGLLIFPQDYTPRTKPGGKWGGSGVKSGPIVYASGVKHPGIEPRQFAKEIAKQYEKEIALEVRSIARKAFKIK